MLQQDDPLTPYTYQPKPYWANNKTSYYMHNMTQNWENKSKHRQKNSVIYVPNTFFYW